MFAVYGLRSVNRKTFIFGPTGISAVLEFVSYSDINTATVPA
jgi:hypothetical protein